MYKNWKKNHRQKELNPRREHASRYPWPLRHRQDLPAFTYSACAKTSIFNTQFLEITEVVGPLTPTLLLIHTVLSVLQVSCRKLREDWRTPLVSFLFWVNHLEGDDEPKVFRLTASIAI